MVVEVVPAVVVVVSVVVVVMEDPVTGIVVVSVISEKQACTLTLIA